MPINKSISQIDRLNGWIEYIPILTESLPPDIRSEIITKLVKIIIQIEQSNRFYYPLIVASGINKQSPKFVKSIDDWQAVLDHATQPAIIKKHIGLR
jgi:hypothetical protein